MRIAVIVWALVLLGGSVAAAPGETPGRQRDRWDAQWLFHRGDAPAAEQPGLPTSDWRTVDLPHDWSIERLPGTQSIFDPESPGGAGGGYLPGGIGWYRKSFTLPASARGRRVFVEFEGVYMDSDVWLNGQHLGNRPYGYSSFEYELTPHLNWDSANVLAVRAKVEQPCSRWFSGAGIYRHVWLTITDPVHVAHWGTYVTTPQVEKAAATVRVRTRVLNQGPTQEVRLRTSVVDAAGQTITETEAGQRAEAGRACDFEQRLSAGAPHRWSPADPYLYTVVSEVLVGGNVVDTYRTPFGIRTIEFTKDRGLLLNGEHVPVQGVCNHHDQGYLGAAAYDRAIQRQIEILKSMGCNAIRTSHNPPAPKLLEWCDRMGMLVMDEAFDEWQRPKTKYGYGRFFDQWSERDLRDLIDRDRNHPSVILWSIGNEIPEQGDAAQGGALAARLAAICREEDPTRPVTSGCNNATGAVKTGYADALDVLGINYHVDQYDTWKGERKLIAAETSSTVSTRGQYNLVLQDDRVTIVPRLSTQCSAYDVDRPPWAVIAELQFKRLKESPWMTGEFVWTGFDYTGEPTPFPWPAASSYFGIVDMCGFPKDRFYLYQSQWTAKPMVHILPHWNWPQFSGREIPVWCYTNADSVELLLGGRSLGEKRPGEGGLREFVIEHESQKKKKPQIMHVETGWFHAQWNVPYRPGVLKAVARRGGLVVATDEVATAGAPAKIAMSVDRRRIAADGQDLAYVTVRVVDAQGRVGPEADHRVRFQLRGPGSLAAVGNGDPTDHDDYLATGRKAFHGLCLAIVKAGREPGTIRLAASADGLQGDVIEIQTDSE